MDVVDRDGGPVSAPSAALPQAIPSSMSIRPPPGPGDVAESGIRVANMPDGAFVQS